MTNPPRSTTIAQAEMRAINRSAVLEYLRLAKTASRSELAARLNISKPTAMRIVEELLANGWVRSAGQKEGGVGRAQNLLAQNTTENLVMGIDLGGNHISGGIANLGGEILYRAEIQQHWTDAAGVFAELLRFIGDLREASRGFAGRMLGVTIGVPGIIASREGIVKIAPSLDWKDFPLLERLQPQVDLPVIVENDVNLAVLGEHWYGAGVGVGNLVLIAIGTGIGAGIILENKLYRGHRESSGEIGYLLPGIDFLDRQYPGFGALESLASGRGIAQRAEAVLNTGPGSQHWEAIDVFKAAQENQPWAQRIIAETLDYLTLAIANVSVCFDPELIVLGGGVSRSLGVYLPQIQQRLAGLIPFVPRLEASQLSRDAALLGAVVRTFQKSTDYAAIQAQ